MTDISSINIKDLITSIGSIFAMVMSVLAIVRSSKIKQNETWEKSNKEHTDAIKEINKTLTDHILSEGVEVAVMKTNIDNLKNVVDSKLDQILTTLEEDKDK
jgi:hypothetical protein